MEFVSTASKEDGESQKESDKYNPYASSVNVCARVCLCDLE